MFKDFKEMHIVWHLQVQEEEKKWEWRLKKAKRREQRQTNDLQKNRLIHPCCHTLQDEKCLQMKPFCLSLVLFCLFALIHDDHVVRGGLLYTGYGLDVFFLLGFSIFELISGSQEKH